MTITISNDSGSVFARGYAHTENGQNVWLEIAPQHPKVTGAILSTRKLKVCESEIVSGRARPLKDSCRCFSVTNMIALATRQGYFLKYAYSTW
jgi:hypothetical protein